MSSTTTKPPSQSAPFDDDIQNPKVAASTLDFLLIELVPLAQRITEQLQAREQALADEYKRSKTLNGATNAPSATEDGAESTATAGASTITSLGFPAMREDTREAVFWRLDSLGYRVGQGLVER